MTECARRALEREKGRLLARDKPGEVIEMEERGSARSGRCVRRPKRGKEETQLTIQSLLWQAWGQLLPVCSDGSVLEGKYYYHCLTEERTGIRRVKDFLKVTQQVRGKQHRCPRLRKKCGPRDGWRKHCK